jgi:CheY-like chemotaxis protein
VCEAAKAAQNQLYSAQKTACENAKAQERAEAETRKSACINVARECSNVRVKAQASGMRGSHILWVDDYPDNNIFEREALTDLGAVILPVKSTAEALSHLRNRNEQFDVIISDMARSDDPKAGYTLLAEVEKLAYRPPYIIYSGRSNPSIVAEAKTKGALGQTNNPKELLDLVITALKDQMGRNHSGK